MSQFFKGEIDPNEEKFLETVARIRNPKPCEKLKSKNPSTQKCCVRLGSHKGREAFAVRI
jgi:hypothetical protein